MIEIFIVFLLGVVSAQFTLDDNTVALWHFDEASGNTVFDETSNNNDGTILGAKWTNDSTSGFALKFDGIDDKIIVPYSSSIGALPNLTLDAWVKRNSLSDGMVISKNGPYFISIRNNVLEGGVYAGPGWTQISGTTSLNLGQWYHIALTYDGADIKLYLDGVEDASITKTGSILVTGQSLHIGWGEPGHNQFFNGIIDEVRISDIARNNNNSGGGFSLEERVRILEKEMSELKDRTSLIEKTINRIIEFIRGLPQGSNWFLGGSLISASTSIFTSPPLEKLESSS